jgi:hypothetical protein
LHPVELENRRRINIRVGDVREIDERLKDVAQAIEPKRAILNFIPFPRDLEGTLDAGVENRSPDWP